MRRSGTDARDRVDPSDGLIREVGAELRHARLQRGEELDAVAQYLRIRPAYLSAIEQGDLAVMPGRTYALGFLRTYADYLGFDGNDLIGRVKSSVGELTDRTRLRMRTPVPETRLPRTSLIVLSLAIVAGIYLGWSYVNRTTRTASDTVAEVPPDLREAARDRLPPAIDDRSAATATRAADEAAAPDAAPPRAAAEGPPSGATSAAAPVAEEPGAPAAAEPATEVGAAGATSDMAAAESPAERDALAVRPAAGGGAEETGQVTMPAAGSPSGVARAPEVAAAPAATADQSGPAATAAVATTGRAEPADPARQAVALLLEAAAGAAAGAPQVYERANTDARVILRAREQAWIEVSSPSGDYTFTRTLAPGEALLVPNRPDLELWTGNAAGLEIIVDGVPVSLPGTRLVRRNVSLDPERLTSAAAPR